MESHMIMIISIFIIFYVETLNHFYRADIVKSIKHRDNIEVFYLNHPGNEDDGLIDL